MPELRVGINPKAPIQIGNRSVPSSTSPPPMTQPVMGQPIPVGGTGGTGMTGGASGAGVQQGSFLGQAPAQPTPQARNIGATQPANPYNLPQDLVQGMTQGQQLQGVLGQFEQSRQQANQANEQRYSDILGGYGNLENAYSNRTQGLLSQIGNMGQAQQQQLQQKFEQQGAGLTQDFINRGLYNATAMDSARQGLSRQQQQQQLQLDDQLLRQKLDYGAKLTGEELAARPMKLQFMENREDIGPSYQDVAGLSSAVGASKAGIPDYSSGLGYGQAVPAGSAPSTGQAPIAGPNPVGPGRTDLPAITRPPGGLTSTGGLTSPAQMQFGAQRATGGSTGFTNMSGGQRSGGGGGSGGGSDFETTGGYDPFGDMESSSSSSNQSSGSQNSGGSGTGTTPQQTSGGGGPVEKSPEVTGSDFYQRSIAPQLAMNPNWDWVNDPMIYAMAPTNLQARINEIRKTRGR